MAHNVEVVKEVKINKTIYKVGESLSVTQTVFDLHKDSFQIPKVITPKKDKAVEEK
jgi:hypothetical protein